MVSIPFIAGQWSLRGSVSATGRSGRVSIPFIAGQWSLRDVDAVIDTGGVWFQSPSLRGSGRFEAEIDQFDLSAAGFNPLHCGAVVASGIPIGPWLLAAVFQSPSLRGSGRFSVLNLHHQVRLGVSIPFIAGQWSLLHDDALQNG